MLTKIHRKEAIQNYSNLPLQHYNRTEKQYELHYPVVFSQYILTLPSKSFKGHIKLLGKEIANLATNLGFENFIFLTDGKTPWLYRDHPFKHAKEGLQYLAENKIGGNFNGAIQVNTTQLPTFIMHLGWMVRTNAILPSVYFTDPGQNIIGNICHYGNLHISTLSPTTDKMFKEIIATSNFVFLKSYSCNIQFSKRGAIKGRKIIL